MDFVTLHELSVQFDVSVRVLRHRLHRLLAAGKLTEGQDCRREDYKDDTHFVWKINPLAFMRVTGLRLHPVTKPVNQMGNEAIRPVTSAPPQASQTLPKLDTPQPGLEREMIDLLKGQVRVKDVQIGDLTEQNKTLNSLNLKLTTRIVHQDDKIHDLLRLTGGKSEMDDLVTKPVNPVVTQDDDLGANGQPVGNQAGNQEEGGEVAA